jgi:hypothetical protein
MPSPFLASSPLHLNMHTYTYLHHSLITIIMQCLWTVLALCSTMLGATAFVLPVTGPCMREVGVVKSEAGEGGRRRIVTRPTNNLILQNASYLTSIR